MWTPRGALLQPTQNTTSTYSSSLRSRRIALKYQRCASGAYVDLVLADLALLAGRGVGALRRVLPWARSVLELAILGVDAHRIGALAGGQLVGVRSLIARDL